MEKEHAVKRMKEITEEINSNVGIGEYKRSLIELLGKYTSRRRAGETIRITKKQDKS